ncbi:unnamed protein product [Clavelina lepadiformis]|uniref:Uncharacterized protein n=1 Tax=Clavelina lepadiformis TaxID=159417 RepID=A0ABP0GE80_CLALP
MFVDHASAAIKMIALGNSEMITVTDWLITDKILSFNLGKTKFIIFSTNPVPPDSNALIVNSRKIENVKTIKFLGIHISESLWWKDHVKSVLQKIKMDTGAIMKIKAQLNQCLFTL